MGKQQLNDRNIRKIQRTGRAGESYMVTLPKELIAELGWQKKQKVVVTKKGKFLIITDWNRRPETHRQWSGTMCAIDGG